MATSDQLIRLEREAWQALSTSGEAATSFYDGILADDVMILLPGGTLIDDRAKVVASMSGDPWESFDLSEERVLELSDSVAMLVYRVTATRHGQEYNALLSSTYVREDGAWRLAIHQQTPV
ncbi:MAG TPA: nuclear transport factor 2 family protein [Acidimicrobiia bacterium]|nr:nuclear transport factor 2 family protein [Acidimicrobiia bacterium]